MAQLEYFGEHNFYEGMEIFWKIVPPEPAPAESFDFEMWRAHWTGENRPAWQRVKWQNPPDRNRPAHEHRVADYTLDLQGNPAIKSSSGPADAGFRSGLLPRLPEPDTDCHGRPVRCFSIRVAPAGNEMNRGAAAFAGMEQKATSSWRHVQRTSASQARIAKAGLPLVARARGRAAIHKRNQPAALR